MSETSDRTPLLPHPVQAQGRSGSPSSSGHPGQSGHHGGRPGPSDSHPIYLRACHSSWRIIDQRLLLLLRLLLTGYLSAVFGVSLKYKLDGVEDIHTPWRILFQFSTVSFCTQWAWHLLVTLWTAMHLIFPKAIEIDPDECHGHKFRAHILRFLSPPNTAACPIRRFFFSMFYTIAHVFPFMNTLVYWGCLVPCGHGGFKPPSMPHSHGDLLSRNSTARFPNKGLLELEPIDSFSIINVWSITSIIALIEIGFLNSIRRQTPITAHIAGVMFCSGAYLGWAGLGKVITGHSGLFFLDPDIMKEMPGAIIATCIVFISVSPGVFSYMYGLIAMRETITAKPSRSSS
ncbi:uncharacterized protein F4807DRAFT_443984 [Annulohypoxylon truncatum]|uniref:uncharacterized protein n=1 Tax=Annulohypoxylon truncatum TaxID=327061 RepID=UPI002008DF88|nr:uncharacterized protein F4807DRAFT_443984 [Annulohypoxylon truncatum]KAI1205237.1 hypothetical protein F4807DRAFT_443984 [Annulohypoxylon truncatum]